jgi:hypothetical protein
MADAKLEIDDPRRSSLAVRWSADYHSEWDERPEEYLLHGLVGWGRSRRLARAEDRAAAFKAYLGVQHDDPARWHIAGDARSVFFLSLFMANRTINLRTFTSMGAALAELRRFHRSLCPA